MRLITDLSLITLENEQGWTIGVHIDPDKEKNISSKHTYYILNTTFKSSSKAIAFATKLWATDKLSLASSWSLKKDLRTRDIIKNKPSKYSYVYKLFPLLENVTNIEETMQNDLNHEKAITRKSVISEVNMALQNTIQQKGFFILQTGRHNLIIKYLKEEYNAINVRSDVLEFITHSGIKFSAQMNKRIPNIYFQTIH